MKRKPLTDKQIRNRLQKKVDQLFNKREQEALEFSPDVETKQYHSWIVKSNRDELELACDKFTGVITVCGR